MSEVTLFAYEMNEYKKSIIELIKNGDLDSNVDNIAMEWICTVDPRNNRVVAYFANICIGGFDSHEEAKIRANAIIDKLRQEIKDEQLKEKANE